MLTLDTDQLSTQEIQQYLQYAIAPRPICFASTIDLEGNVNLSPFSFFNLFSMNPPICIFSPSRRVRDNTTKHTLENIKVVPEVVINIVNYNMVQQVSLSSCDYPKGTNEFTKAGFTTIDLEGNVNLSPFSFFNLFSMNPPICIFSPSRRVRDNTTKHTLENIKVVPECVINIVNYNMVQQVSLSSCDYPKGTSEFTKAGFTELASELVRPPRVAESPIQLECIVQEVIALGAQAGAGNLVLAEIKKIHLHESILDASNHIDQAKLDLVARLGGDWYARITEANLFKVEKPNTKLGIGFDQLPRAIKESDSFTPNEKAQLANTNMAPVLDSSNELKLSSEKIQQIKAALSNNDTELAWAIIQTSV